MTTQIAVETLSPITHNQIPVITTELLAQLYGTEPVRIRQNHHENKVRFVEGKHFFKVVGNDLKELRVALNYSQNPVSPKARSLILWTERGAARHAKMLETDQAWEVFEKLEDCYFSQKNPSVRVSRQKSYDTRVLCYQQSGVTVSTIPLRDDDIVISLESWLELARANGWFVIRKDQLVEKLMQL
ncbi:ORF6N domain-containing protein [Salmonella enterica subsp. enterica]|uniref:ORF6N domain-containing protein n=2 Tax=Salmonella enterica I TaxID=59201 RepID=A0A612C4V6_SALMO|nr:ORF6N domain-containing protein [Salmonella enterica]EAY2756098.1 ORF6N domain-containing protein [Salmonella enterica subsp. enterica serovar Typhimurium]EBG9603267.1 ORF6N domain-containing protein [Salmonella enterica subsp. enterica serovar Arechavaleta]EBW0588030.1 ORF6N domain-containing protein [Salmonella enterica subsp. enterica serovar Saintpaul]ECD1638845.1 ORF6N domain-containing protein [Salmonella enterica subsp. enterica serovar Enteritidis]ECF2477029.1 ORF6N domain-containin